MHDKIREVTDIKNKLIEWTKSTIDMGKECVCTDEAGKVIDMIKDLADAEKNCWKAEYYKEIVEDMREYDCDDERMGYNSRRYASGQYAPKGRGHISGYNGPYFDMDRYPNYNALMGYPTRTQVGTEMRTNLGYTPKEDKYGRSYKDFQYAKRHYTETKSPHDKMEMDSHISEHVGDTITTMKEVWHSADPEMKKRIKNDLTNLIAEMTV